MENQPEEPVELMYRPPGRNDHQNITEVLDEIMNRLEIIEHHIVKLEEKM